MQGEFITMRYDNIRPSGDPGAAALRRMAGRNQKDMDWLHAYRVRRARSRWRRFAAWATGIR